MKSLWWVLLVVLVAAFGLTVVACGDDDDDDDDAVADDDASGDDDDTCSVEWMCSWAEECGFYTSSEACIADYETYAADCADVEGDLACECECVATATECNSAGECSQECMATYC